MSVRLAIATWPADAPWGAVAAFCALHGMSRSWFYELRARAAREGPLGATVTRSRAPRRSPSTTPASVEDAALLVRKQLAEQGWDNGPISVRQEMLTRGMPAPSRATLARIFTRRGAVVPAPAKRPRSTFTRFAYAAPNECWQLDGMQWPLADGSTACILQVIDDHTRRMLASRAATAETSEDVQAVLAKAIDRFGLPQRFLSDNGTAMNPSRRGRRGVVETWLTGMGVQCITSSVGHPQTMGKAERCHQTTERWLAARPQAGDIEELQAQLDTLEDGYNNRPHQSLGQLTPLQAWAATPVAIASPAATAPPSRLLHHKVLANGTVMAIGNNIGLGQEMVGQRVIINITGDQVEVFDQHGTHLRTVTLAEGKTYYGTGRPRGALSHRKRPASPETPQPSGTT